MKITTYLILISLLCVFQSCQSNDNEEDPCVLQSFPDFDCDGVPDSEDNCPTVANEDQTDSDNDGCGDVCSCLPDLN